VQNEGVNLQTGPRAKYRPPDFALEWTPGAGPCRPARSGLSLLYAIAPVQLEPAPAGTSEAVRRGRYSIAGERADVIDIPDGSIRATEGNFEHLIEVAVVETPVPSDADHGATHQRVHRRRIEVIHEQAHILRVIAGGS